jgi:hypothetical protein
VADAAADAHIGGVCTAFWRCPRDLTDVVEIVQFRSPPALNERSGGSSSLPWERHPV